MILAPSGYPQNPVISGAAAAGQLLTATSATAASWAAPPFGFQAGTGLAGYTLVNGTGNIITWTAPNDGALHRALIMWTLHVTSTETGGQLSVTVTTPDGGAATFANAVSAGGQTTGTFTPGTNGYFVQAAGTLVIKQNTALTAGAAVLWAEIYAS